MNENIDWSKFKGKSLGRKSFIRLLNILDEKQYTLISDYYRVCDKITVRCDKGHLFNMRCSDILNGCKCNKCSGHDTEYVKVKFYDAINESGYSVLGEYKDGRTAISLLCDRGHKVSISPTKFMMNRRCSVCAKNSNADFRKRLLNKAKELNFKVLDVPLNTVNSISFECDKGHVFKRNPSNFYNLNSKCPICNKGNRKMPLVGDAFNEYVASFGYKAIGIYVNNATKIEFRCDKGHIYKTTPKAFKSGCRCPKCSNVCPEQAKENFIKVCNDNNYTVIGKYVSTKVKVKIRCSKGHEFSARPNDITMGSRCPKCANTCPEQSKEKFLKILEKKNYKLTGVYTGNMNPVEMQCNIGHKFIRRPNDIHNGYGCRICAHMKTKC